jgi:tetratricopeptide (TPR) repeat protein
MKVLSHRWLLMAVALAGAVGWWFAFRPSPPQLLERGLKIGRRNNAAGEELVRQAIDRAGGRYPDAELGLALLLADRDDWQSAEQQFAKLDPDACRSDLLLEFGRRAFDSGHADVGIAALQAVGRRENRDRAAAFEALVHLYQSRGQTDLAIDTARVWAERDPANARPWMLRIPLLKTLERRDPECLEAVRQALARDLSDEDRQELQHRLVEQLIICGDAVEARRELAPLVQTAGETFRVRLLEMDLYRLEGRPEKALELMNRVFSEARDPAEACFNRSIIYLDLERYADAARDLERTIAAQPRNATAHFKLSEAYRALGRPDDARRHRELAEKINGSSR